MEVLACPHCERMFNAVHAIFGKVIRCRGCRKPFRIPNDLSIGTPPPEANEPQHRMLIAMECVIDGVDARRCPACRRTFSMQRKFVGKVIRCRGCQTPFFVVANSRTPPSVTTPSSGSLAKSEVEAAPVDACVSEPAFSGPVPPVVASSDVSDDGGDVLDEAPAGEPGPVLVAVRPRRRWTTRPAFEPVRGPFRSGRV